MPTVKMSTSKFLFMNLLLGYYLAPALGTQPPRGAVRMGMGTLPLLSILEVGILEVGIFEVSISEVGILEEAIRHF
jgi:hypothetical protein